MILKSKWKIFGHAAHFCGAENCRFHLATQVGRYLVSTVGDYWPQGAKEKTEIGLRRTFETMVFVAGKPCTVKDCECGLPEISGSEIDFSPYNFAKDAIAGHEAMCLKWAKNKKKESKA